jgi:hypothetical protein
MIMQGGLHMVSFRNVVVFIAVVGLMFGLASMADAAHTKSHRAKRATTESGEPTTLPGRGPGAPVMIVQGPVASVDPAVGFIVIRHGAGKNADEMPVEIDTKTTLMKAGRKINIDEVKAGDRVKITYGGEVAAVTKMIDVMAGPSTRARRRA